MADKIRVGMIGVGGIGTGTLIELDGDETLGRTESRMGRLLDARDYFSTKGPKPV